MRFSPEAGVIITCRGSLITRTGVSFTVGSEDRRRLEAIVADRNTKQKHVWRVRIIIESGDGCGTMEIMRRTGRSKTCVWRWQERYMEEGVDGLLYDATRPPNGILLATVLGSDFSGRPTR